MADTTHTPNKDADGYPILVPLGTERTGFGGCIGTADKTGPIPGFAEIDPNGQFADDDEADALAAEMCRRWNAHAELLEALKRFADFADQGNAFGYPPGSLADIKALIARAVGRTNG